MRQQGLAPILIVLLIVAAIGGYLIYSGKINLPQKQVNCTQEAKICPDGSKVGRSGPKCEFSPCPTPKTDETVFCNTDTDCGLNICECKALRKEFIRPVDTVCARVCEGEVRCINYKCALIKTK